MQYPGFVGPSNQSQSPIADCERLVNFYVEPSDAGTGRPALYPFPGMKRFATVTATGGRAMAQMNNRTLAVMGGNVHELFSNNVVSASYGMVTVDSNPAQISFNGAVGNQALIASAGNAYTLNLATNALTQVLTGDAFQIGMMDGYFIALNPSTGHIRISALNNGAAGQWDPTQFAGRSQQPDTWKAMIVRAPDIILIGDLSGDVWFDAGNFPFPFVPRVGFTFFYGIVAPFSLAASVRTCLWLSKNADGNGMLVRMDGYTPQPVESFAFDNAVSTYKDQGFPITDAEGMIFQYRGHPFYILRFPTANHTWAYDLRTNLMFEVGHFNSVRGDYDAWSPRVTCPSFGMTLVADSSNIISSLDVNTGTESNGDPIRRMRIPPALVATNGTRVFIDRFEMGLQPGLGQSFAQSGNEPHVMVRWSPDFGRTWGNELQLGVGAQGQYSRMVFHTIAGSSLKSMVPEITVTDPVPIRIVGASLLGRGIANETTR